MAAGVLALLADHLQHCEGLQEALCLGFRVGGQSGIGSGLLCVGDQFVDAEHFQTGLAGGAEDGLDVGGSGTVEKNAVFSRVACPRFLDCQCRARIGQQLLHGGQTVHGDKALAVSGRGALAKGFLAEFHQFLKRQLRQCQVDIDVIGRGFFHACGRRCHAQAGHI